MSKITDMLYKQAEDLRILADQSSQPTEADLIKQAAIKHLVEQGVDSAVATKLIEARVKNG